MRRYTGGALELEGLVTNTIGVSIYCVAIDPKATRAAVSSEYASIPLTTTFPLNTDVEKLLSKL